MNLVMGQDERVAAWMFQTWNVRPMQFNMAVGISDDAGNLTGGIMFTNYNGSDAEVHFVGPGFLKRRVVRTIFSIAVAVLNLNRLTVHTRKEGMARGVTKLGAVYEGTVRRLYGPTDDDHHAARRYAFFRERMTQLAGLKGK